jgi:hypothetical protein
MSSTDMADRFRGASYDGLVHVTRTAGDTWSLCGTPTDRQVHAMRGAPCATCMTRAAEEIVDAEELAS